MEVALSPAGGPSHLAEVRAATSPKRDLQVQPRPQFDAKLADIVGLYLDPEERALVLCVDEKPQIRALKRTQSALRIWSRLLMRMIHDYIRHGTTSLFAALEVAMRQGA
jgi:hypothetical protein